MKLETMIILHSSNQKNFPEFYTNLVEEKSAKHGALLNVVPSTKTGALS